MSKASIRFYTLNFMIFVMSLRSRVHRINDKTGGCEQRILIFAFS